MLLKQDILNGLFDAGAVKINQTQFRQKSEELMIFGAGHADCCTPKNRIAAKHETRRLEQKGIRIGVGVAGVIEVRPILNADTGLNQSLDHDLGVCRNLQVDSLALKE